jgi:hypothetical protein
MTEPKRHHTVPRTYLERFTAKDDFLTVYSKFAGKKFKQRSTQATVQNYYYSQPDPDTGGRNNKLETDFFFDFEDAYPLFRETLLENSTKTDIEQLVNQLLIQRVRSPAFREAFEIGLAQYVQRHINALPKSDFPDPPLHLPNIFDELVVTIDPHRSIAAMAHYIKSYGLVLWELDYQVKQVHKQHEAITSDNPVIWFAKKDYKASSLIYPNEITSDFTLVYPIDRKHYLIGRPTAGDLPSCRFDPQPMDRQYLNFLKRTQFACSWDKVIGQYKPDSKSLAQLHGVSPSMQILHFNPDTNHYKILYQKIQPRDKKHKHSVDASME